MADFDDHAVFGVWINRAQFRNRIIRVVGNRDDSPVQQDHVLALLEHLTIPLEVLAQCFRDSQIPFFFRPLGALASSGSVPDILLRSCWNGNRRGCEIS